MAGSPVIVSFRNNTNITHTFIKSSSIEKIKLNAIVPHPSLLTSPEAFSCFFWEVLPYF